MTGRGEQERFSGWRMVALCSLAYGLSAPGQTAGISVFIDPMIDTLALTRAEVSLAYLVGTLASAALLPTVGRQVDRFGSRRSMLVIGGCFGIVLALVAGVRGLVTLTVGFIAIRLLGQGALTLVSTTAIAPWFVRRRGVAVGVTTAVGPALISLLPVGSAALIAAVGWRSTWLVLAVAVAALTIPMAWWGIIDRPEQVGQRADGDHRTDSPTPAPEATLPSFSRRAALSTPLFWVIAATIAATSSIGTGMRFHQIDLLGEQGLSPLQAAANFLPQTAAVLVSTMLVGFLADRVAQRWILVAAMGSLAGAMLLVPHVTPGASAIAYGLVLGAGASVTRMVETAVVPHVYGVDHLGAIRGVLRGIIAASSAIGPVAVAAGRTLTGSYQGVLLPLLVVPAAIAVVAALVPTPGRPPDDGEPA